MTKDAQYFDIQLPTSNNFDFRHLHPQYPEKTAAYLYPVMLTQATYQQAGIPSNILGQSYQKWRSDDLRLLLEHFGITTLEAAQKIDLVHAVHHLIENQLMPNDPNIFARLQEGRSLPTFSSVATLGLGGRTLEDVLGGQLTSARIKNFQRQRQRFTSEDFALPDLETSSPTRSSEMFSRQGDPDAQRFQDTHDNEDLLSPKTDCAVCLEPLTAEVQNATKITRACNHRRDVCDECLREAITIDLEQKVWDRIGCPSCGTLMAQEDVIKYGEPKAVAKYEERLTLASLSSNPNFHLCRHPGCTFGQEMAPHTNQQFMTCLQCRRLTCLSCSTVWHAGISCAANVRNIRGPTAEEQKEEEASEALVAKTSKTCPNAKCGARVEKISGCDHVRCLLCGSQYCWECQVDQEKIWGEGNSAHDKGCKHWRPLGKDASEFSENSEDDDVTSPDESDEDNVRLRERRVRQRRGAIAELRDGMQLLIRNRRQHEQGGAPPDGPVADQQPARGTIGQGRAAWQQGGQGADPQSVPRPTEPPLTEVGHEALLAAARRGQQADAAMRKIQSASQQQEQYAARHPVNEYLHEQERMPARNQGRRQEVEFLSGAQNVAHHQASAAGHNPESSPPQQGYSQQRRQEPTQPTQAPNPAHRENAAMTQPATSSSRMAHQPPSQTPLAPPGLPRVPPQAPQPARRTPLYPPGLPPYPTRPPLLAPPGLPRIQHDHPRPPPASLPGAHQPLSCPSCASSTSSDQAITGRCQRITSRCPRSRIPVSAPWGRGSRFGWRNGWGARRWRS